MTQIANLEGVHPRLVEAVKRLTYAGHELGVDIVVTEGVSQKPAHRPRKDGFGYVVRVAFRLNGEPSFDPALPWWGLLVEMAKSQGLRPIADPSHLELPYELLH